MLLISMLLGVWTGTENNHQAVRRGGKYANCLQGLVNDSLYLL
jgi:hypothetical protein